jgi:HAD superfamily hydrolase (TIGR01484 family)
MRYLALATDYDGTLAAAGHVARATLDALHRLRDSGRKLLLVTGRELPDLMQVFPEYAIFDRIVAENGALLFAPQTREERVLGEAPPRALVERLRQNGVSPLSEGRVILATWSPHQNTVLEAIHELGLELQVIFNKGAVMVLPTGINKAMGLRAALEELSLSPHNTVGVGDAENDHALLAECELSVAVQNALPALQERADLVTSAPAGEGVCELIEGLLRSDMRELAGRLARHDLTLGTRNDGAKLDLHPYGHRVLVCGTSGSGKSALVTSLLERLNEKRYQFCLIDPEGDFRGLQDTLLLGDQEQAPSPEQVLAALRAGDKSLVVNLLAVPQESRSVYFASLMARCVELRVQTGRPHFIVVDEAHHMLQAGEVELPAPLSHPPRGLLLITVQPDQLAAAVLRKMDTLIVRGHKAREMIAQFAAASGRPAPALDDCAPLGNDEAFAWSCGAPAMVRFRPAAPKVYTVPA